jgi:hypothetical protein
MEIHFPTHEDEFQSFVTNRNLLYKDDISDEYIFIRDWQLIFYVDIKNASLDYELDWLNDIFFLCYYKKIKNLNVKIYILEPIVKTIAYDILLIELSKIDYVTIIKIDRQRQSDIQINWNLLKEDLRTHNSIFILLVHGVMYDTISKADIGRNSSNGGGLTGKEMVDFSKTHDKYTLMFSVACHGRCFMNHSGYEKGRFVYISLDNNELCSRCSSANVRKFISGFFYEQLPGTYLTILHLKSAFKSEGYYVHEPVSKFVFDFTMSGGKKRKTRKYKKNT